MSLQETQSRVDFSSQAKSFGGTNPQFIEQMKSNWAPVVACSYSEAKQVPIIQGKPCAALQ
jgi:hypothetical protein